MVAPRTRDVSWDEFYELWSDFLEDLHRAGTIVVVEGERDRASLEKLGVRAPIRLVHGGRTLARLAESLSGPGHRVVVLTDWDGEGGHLAQRLKEFLGHGEIVLDLDFRRRLAHVVRGEIVHVEGLAGWVRRLAEREGTSIEVFRRGRDTTPDATE
ncbi:MAG: toprim domain-containing protein [Thermoplasmata archaeon]